MAQKGDDFVLDQMGKKKTKLEHIEIDYENRPIVFHGRSLYVFVEKCPRQLSKFLKDISEPISKPQKVHEYQITKDSLVRAQALGYKKDTIIETLQKNMQNRGRIPEDIRRKICESVSENQCELYLVWVNQACHYRFVVDKKLFQSIRNSVEDYLEDKTEIIKGDAVCLAFRVKKFNHIQLEKKLLDLSMPVKSDRVVYSFLPEIKKLRGVKHVPYCHPIQINLKSFTELREYQAEALNSIVKVQGETTSAKSGYVVLPCGAGKTLLGISILCKVKKQTMIVCNNDSGAEQWKREIQKWTQSFPREEIIIITSENKYKFKNSQRGQIFISTYSFLKNHINKQREIGLLDEWLVSKPWGLMIFDECQTLPAEDNSKIVISMLAQVKIGLTATPVREDGEFKALNFMVGPQLYSGDWRSFVDQGYLANPKCIEIRTELTSFFKQKYRRFEDINSRDGKQLCYKINPNKIKALLFLLYHHEQLNDHILVFSDDVDILHYIAGQLKRPVLSGSSKAEERMFIFDMFRQGKVKTLFLSRIGDEAVDLPNANVGIELNLQHGSRKQMLQRLGRIMRQKQASSSLSYNAMFYTITTYETLEWKYFFKRYKCLINEGFHYDLRLFEFRREEIDSIENILELDKKVRDEIEQRFKVIVDNQEIYWGKFYKGNQKQR